MSPWSASRWSRSCGTPAPSSPVAGTTIVEALDYLLEQHPEFAVDRRGLARIEGQQAFALAALGRRREALAQARRDTLRHHPLERRALVTVPVLLGLVRAGRSCTPRTGWGAGSDPARVSGSGAAGGTRREQPDHAPVAAGQARRATRRRCAAPAVPVWKRIGLPATRCPALQLDLARTQVRQVVVQHVDPGEREDLAPPPPRGSAMKSS